MVAQRGGSTAKTVRVGVDIGGTFTDMVVLDESTGEIQNFKGLSTPGQFAEGVLKLITESGLKDESISFISHGTTVGINAVLERKGPPTGIVTNKGFEDILELRRCARTHVLDPFMEKPWMFVPRRLRLGVTERTRSDGSIETALNKETARAALKFLSDQGVQSVAICLLNSYSNAAHEEELKELVESEFPDMFCATSSETVPEMREYERTSTTALNAYLLPVLEGYLTKLSVDLRERGIRTDFHVMQSNGQLMTRRETANKPVHTLESGPAAGSMAASYIAKLLGYSNAVTFDMGGTTCKSTIIEEGLPRQTLSYELFEEASKPGSGWPIRVPMIDILEIPLAGGSMSWVDTGGSLHVGPESVGAKPGPVCYDLGGKIPTITDADVVTGRIEGPLSGGLKLNLEKARQAVMKYVGSPLDLSIEQAAAGVLEVADARAADVVRQLTVARGRDPRDSVLVAFGGAGPLHASQVIEEMNMPEAIIPPAAGNFSAFGLLSSNVGHNSARTQVMRTSAANPSLLNSIFGDLETSGATLLKTEGAPANEVAMFRSVDMRYARQLHDVNIPVPNGLLSSKDIDQLTEKFHQTHLLEFGYDSRANPTEIVTFRVRAVWQAPHPELREIKPGKLADALKKHRSVYFREVKQWVECPVYQRERIGQGCQIIGPAVIEEETSTTIVPPSFTATVDKYGNIRLRKVA